MTRRIDPKSEDLGRWAVTAAVAKDSDQLLAAFDAIGSASQEIAENALALYTAVARAALLAIHDGEVPSERQNRELADDVLRDESTWSPIQAEDVYQFLEGLCSDTTAPDIPPERFPTTMFVTLGHLVKWYDAGLGYKHYDDFLDALIAGRLKKGEPS